MQSFFPKVTGWFARRPVGGLAYPVEEFLKSVSLVVGLEQLLEILSAKLRDLSGAESVYLALYEPITNRYAGRKAKGDAVDLLSHLNFLPSDKLVSWLSVNQTPLDVARQPEVVRFLSGHEQDLLSELKIALVIPFIAVNRLAAAAFFSQKGSETAYETVEIERLTALSNHTALAIEHAMMYQFQEDRLKKIFHADKLATIGELAAGAAHEIRNPLTSIRATVQFLKKDLSARRRPLVDGIIEEVDRIDHIITGLLSLSKSSGLKISRVDLHEILRQTLMLLDSELRGHRIVVEEKTGLEDPTMHGDSAQLKQLFLNILLNSIQSMPDGGRISVSLRGSSQSAGIGHDRSVLTVAIKDTGTGIPEGDLPRVFDPFFTTKKEGTGLGLSISYGIVSKHGGEIHISSSTSEPERGTTVSVILPRHIDEKRKAS
jgi:signal transduction histidine kinase